MVKSLKTDLFYHLLLSFASTCSHEAVLLLRKAGEEKHELMFSFWYSAPTSSIRFFIARVLLSTWFSRQWNDCCRTPSCLWPIDKFPLVAWTLQYSVQQTRSLSSQGAQMAHLAMNFMWNGGNKNIGERRELKKKKTCFQMGGKSLLWDAREGKSKTIVKPWEDGLGDNSQAIVGNWTVLR